MQKNLLHLLSDNSSAEVHQWQWFRLQTTQVFHCDFAVAPYRRDNWVNLFSTESAMRHSKKLSLDAKGEGSLLHVKDNEEFVRHSTTVGSISTATVSSIPSASRWF